MVSDNDIAIIGMSCIFPGAADIDSFWKNIITGFDAIKEAPENRIDPCYFDAKSQAVDRLYCYRGGFIDEFMEFNPMQFGVVPSAVDGTEPDHLIALSLTRKALDDAGVIGKHSLLDKAGIIIGKGNYLGRGALSLIEIVRTGEQVVKMLESLLPGLGEQQLETIKRQFQGQKAKLSPETAMGLIPNLVASIVANRFGLGGAAYTLDAACASSLIAVDHAVRELRSQRCDLVVAGGIHTCHEPSFWTIFNQLGALSRNQRIRPFDQKADGILIGEGCGFVVLRRLSDAIKDNQKIYAVIKGTGVSSDGMGVSLLRPAIKGQIKAIQSAWMEAQLDYDTIGYLEAHGTATPVGDKTELETLAHVFGKSVEGKEAGFGSIKSMIGHAMPAAGIAGLIKTALSLYHGKLPPTLHCEQPLQEFSTTRFVPVQKARDWDDLPRRAGVNAFGFGGINAHAVLDAFDVPIKLSSTSVSVLKERDAKGRIHTEEVLLLARNTDEELISALTKGDFVLGEGICRVAIFNPTSERIDKTIGIIKQKKPWRNRLDIWYTNEPLLMSEGKIAFLFPGIDGLSESEITSIIEYFNLPAPAYSESSDLIKEGIKIAKNSKLVDFVLKKSGIAPDVVAGHSIGEWSACVSAGTIDEESMGQLHERLNNKQADFSETFFLTVGGGKKDVDEILKQVEDVYLSNDNCPHQVILCGTKKAIELCRERLSKKQIINYVLPFQSGFHTPFAKKYVSEIVEAIDLVIFRKSVIPVWSTVTVEPYPDDVDQIRKLQVDHLLSPVRFREVIEKLYADKVKAFIQIGGGALSGFVEDTLKGEKFLSMATSSSKRSGLSQVQRVIVSLFVEGKQADLSSLNLVKGMPKGMAMKLKLGLPLARKFNSIGNTFLPYLTNKAVPITATTLSRPVLEAFNESVGQINKMQSEIADLFQQKIEVDNVKKKNEPVVQHPVTTRSFTMPFEISLEKYPTLIDHSLTRQKPGWHCIEDMVPIVPMTMTLQLLAEMALQKAPGKKVHMVRNFRVHQWIVVDKPFQKAIRGEWKDENTIQFDIDNYVNAEVVLKDRLDEPVDVFIEGLGNPLEIPISEDQIYKEFMFHGPEYQGIEVLTAMGDKGLSGQIVCKQGKGSLLDNAGQLVGLWLNMSLPVDHVAFPVKIDEIQFFSDVTVQEGRMGCSCRLQELTDDFAVSDIELKQNGRMWATIRGWRNRRFEMDDRFWKVCIAPLEHRLAHEIAPGVFLFSNLYRRTGTWDFVLYRFCNKSEKEDYALLPLNKKRTWIVSRVVLKDAVRTLVSRATGEELFPAEITINKDEKGKPFVMGSSVKDVHVSLAHKNEYAVATATFHKPAGIDIEEVMERTDDFCKLVFDESELAILPRTNFSAWITRGWVAKEAYGKYCGTGLQGNPKQFKITDIKEEKLLIDNVWINTMEYQNYIIGWTQ